MKHTKEQLEGMSDFEINRAVGKSVLASSKHENHLSVNYEIKAVCFKDDKGNMKYEVDYCNNPSDIMPLVFEAGITMQAVSDGYVCYGDYGYLDCGDKDYLKVNEADSPFDFPDNSIGHKNGLRAAAIVYLLMEGE